eukprot:COSAG01_NODE_3629_length_5848_cov_127.580797_6_plen_75_part_00
MEEKNGFLKFQKNRRVQSRDIMRYVRKSPLGGALDREMYDLCARANMSMGTYKAHYARQVRRQVSFSAGAEAAS